MRRKLMTMVCAMLLMGTVVGSALAQQGALPGTTGWFTVVLIQNVSSTVGGSVTLEAFATTGAATSGDRTSQSFAFDASRQLLQYNPAFPANYSTGGTIIGFAPDLSAGFVGSAVASSDVDIRAVLSLGNNPVGSAGVTGGRASAFSQGIGQAGANTTIFFPSMKRSFPSGANAQSNLFIVQAVADANVTITYSYGTGVTSTQGPVAIAANRQYAFAPANATPAVPAGTLGSVTVMSTSGAIVGTSVEYLDSGIPAKFALATRNFTDADADTELYAPAWKKNFFGGITGMSVQNTAATQASVDLEFTVVGLQPGVAGLVVGDIFRIDNMILPANSSKAVTGFTINSDPTASGHPLPTKGGAAFTVPDGVFTSIKVTSDSTQKLVAVMNETNATGKAQYQVFGKVAGKQNVSLPVIKELFPLSNPNTTGMTVQNVGTVATNVTVNFTEGGSTQSYTYNNLGAGKAIPLFKCSNTCAGWTGTKPIAGKLYAVKVSSSAAPIVVIAQETDQRAVVNDIKIDVKNYEGFGLDTP